MAKLSARELLYGPYDPPKVSVGEYVACELRGLIRVHSWSDRGAIMWPKGIRNGISPGPPSLILMEDLIRAVKKESAIAVAKYWGTTWRTVRVWRRALGVERMTEGSSQLARELGRQDIPIESPKGNAASLLPDPRRKRDAAHAATMRGRKPSQATIAAVKNKWGSLTPEQRAERIRRLNDRRWGKC